ncbi:MAG: hypothetical protein RMI43_05415 [Candidatus Caldarchaeum sp.]|nr:hypothetical protein [Candidatus Caldarchaeum sp.]
MTVFRVAVPYDDFVRPSRGLYGLAGFRTRLTRVFGGAVAKSERVSDVSALMGLSLEDVVLPVYVDVEIDVEVGDVVYVTGESGGGKSLLVRHLAAEMARHPDFSPVAASWELLKDVRRRRPLVDCVGRDVHEAVEILSAAGLSDAFTWFRSYEQLSDGQRMRFLFAKALDSGAKTIVLDEFCSSLDRETAKATAYTLQKAARRRRLTLVAATAVDDLSEDLNPTLKVVKHFGPFVEAKRFTYRQRPCSLLEKTVVEEGSVDDWRLLSFLHYRGHRLGGVAKIFRAVLGGRVVGVVVYSVPFLKCPGYNMFFDSSWYLGERFGNMLRVQRVVVHPSFRGIGVAKKLLTESMPLLGVAFVEILSTMERLVPFTKGLMKSVVVDVSPAKKKLLEEFRTLFGVDVLRHGVGQIIAFAERRKTLGKMRKWLATNLPKYADGKYPAADAAKLLKIFKSSASPKVYGLWVNPDPKYEAVISRALRRTSFVDEFPQ